jgi:hypothetical protein
MKSASCGQMHVVYRTIHNRYYICGLPFAFSDKITEPLEIAQVNGIDAYNLAAVACAKQSTFFLTGKLSSFIVVHVQ